MTLKRLLKTMNKYKAIKTEVLNLLNTTFTEADVKKLPLSQSNSVDIVNIRLRVERVPDDK